MKMVLTPRELAERIADHLGTEPIGVSWGMDPQSITIFTGEHLAKPIEETERQCLHRSTYISAYGRMCNICGVVTEKLPMGVTLN